jgi:hypothetical protein
LPLYTSSRPGTPRYQASVEDASDATSAAAVPQSVSQTIKVALETLRAIQEAIYALHDELEAMEAVSLKE